ncbi:hypothetical protein BFW01_g11403 [Lasiodiplodia theobromae]|nr:hypothetical protein BFW01_g11403 [Lasiodiplodia theobromae]
MGLIQRIVRNEAVQSDPPEIYNARVLLISLAACGGALLFGMDMGIIGGVLTMETFKRQYGLTDKSEAVLANLSSNIVSVIQAGAFAGALFSTWLANKIGRRPSLIVASVLVFIGVAFQAGASGYIELLYVGRLIAGIAIGIASTVNPLYVSENAPRGIRGLLTGLYQLTLVSGLTLAFWINYGSLQHLHGHAQYILPLALQALPALILFVGMLLANESPRYLAQTSPTRALRVLAQLRGLPADHPYVQHELSSIAAQLEEERALAAAGGGATVFALLKEAVAVKSYRRRSVLCVTLMMWSNLTGTNAMTYYSPTIFASVGLRGASVGLLATGVYGIVKMVACAVFIVFVTDTLGRRKSLIWTGVVQGLALFYVGFYIRFDPPVAGSPVSAPGYVAIVAIYIFAAVYQFGWGSVVWTYCSEIPAARLRALNMGMATASQWLFNFVVAKATPSMFATLGKGGFGTYFFYGGCCFVMVVYAFFFVPETKGLSLELMDELFEQDSVRRKFVPKRRMSQSGSVQDRKEPRDKGAVEHIETV